MCHVEGKETVSEETSSTRNADQCNSGNEEPDIDPQRPVLDANGVTTQSSDRQPRTRTSPVSSELLQHTLSAEDDFPNASTNLVDHQEKLNLISHFAPQDEYRFEDIVCCDPEMDQSVRERSQASQQAQFNCLLLCLCQSHIVASLLWKL